MRKYGNLVMKFLHMQFSVCFTLRGIYLLSPKLRILNAFTIIATAKYVKLRGFKKKPRNFFLPRNEGYGCIENLVTPGKRTHTYTHTHTLTLSHTQTHTIRTHIRCV